MSEQFYPQRRGKGQHRRSSSYFEHECPVCHDHYTTQRRSSPHCGRPGCKRIVKLEKQRAAAAATTSSL